MSISYKKLLDMFDRRGITSYTITKKDKIIGQATWKKIWTSRYKNNCSIV